MSDWFWFILVTVYGGCVGSFVNVVIYRLPEGKSLVSPPSSCPRCGHRLAWHDNVPVLGWLWLGGKCRYCKEPISVQYPLIEAVCAGLFALVFWGDYWSGLRGDFVVAGLGGSWPVLVAQLVMVGGLVAATVIDARLFIIPLQIPYAVAVVALVGLPLGAWWWPTVADVGPSVGSRGLAAGVGAATGLLVALVLLKLKVLPRSFDDEPDQSEADVPETFFEHPHPRREVLKELLFLAFPVGGALGAVWWVGRAGGSDSGELSAWVSVLGGVVVGYFVGAGVIWGTRILGTLAFGREAMGLGDVHLLGGIGAVIGAMDVVLAFFVAPFLGLVGAAAVVGVGKLVRSQGIAIPYGPYLAGAAVVMVLFREPLLGFLGML